jgi:hypothetical protein
MWQARAEEIHLQFVKHAQSLGRLTSADEITHFLALAIAGEAGELANLVKKKWQGDAVDQQRLREEITNGTWRGYYRNRPRRKAPRG